MGLALSGFTVRRRRVQVVEVDDLHLSDGSVVIAGANGSGKSSLLAALAGLVPFAGRATVGGFGVGSAPGRRLIGYLPQHPGGFDHMTVIGAMRYALSLSRRPSNESEAVVVLDRVGIEDLAGRRVGSLSGGERQSTHLAIALAGDPGVVLLDEPTVGLDAEHRTAFRRTLRGLATDHLVLTATHLPDDIEVLGDRTLVLRAGKLVFDGPHRELAAIGLGSNASAEVPLDAALELLNRDG